MHQEDCRFDLTVFDLTGIGLNADPDFASCIGQTGNHEKRDEIGNHEKRDENDYRNNKRSQRQ